MTISARIEKSLDGLVRNGQSTDGLLEAYSEPHRRYHTLDHIDDMLASVAEMSASYDLPSHKSLSLELAVWYHDFVYEVGSVDNEVDSAKIALARTNRASVFDAIVRTATHDRPETFWGACLLDADLKGLGSSPLEYLDNRDRIKAEYGPLLPFESWVRGRVAFLTSYLDRPFLFHTSWGARFEARARENMKEELSNLTGECGDLRSFT